MPDERRLFADMLRRLDRKIMPGLSKLTWASKGVVDYFVKDCRKHCAEMLRVVTQVRCCTPAPLLQGVGSEEVGDCVGCHRPCCNPALLLQGVGGEGGSLPFVVVVLVEHEGAWVGLGPGLRWGGGVARVGVCAPV